ncbi:MAG: cytochrome C [Methylococcales bacterium]|nr:cytochrome C [Methylococcales bacterium]
MPTHLKQHSHPRYFLALLLALTTVLILVSPESKAMPSFSRQTGMACSQCHTQAFGPNLTPFGRDFKLGGYTMGGGSGKNAELPPISAMITGSFTNTNKDQTPPDSPTGYNKNNNFTFDEASLFYAGKIYGQVGAFSQLTYNGFDDKLEMDKTDIRFADQLELADLPITYGVSLNNAPTVQDLWNTSTWGFPYTGSGMQPGAGSSVLLDGGLDAQVGGATAYTMINNLLYLEAGAYGSFSSTFQRTFGIAAADRVALDGPAPYWRIALQQDWKGHFFALGHYGLSADVLPGRDSSNGANHYTDVAFDATYQYMANPKHIFEAKTAYIYEDQRLSADRQVESDPNSGNTYLNTFKFNAAYTFEQTYGVTFGYNKINGSRGPIFANGIDEGQTRPNSEYFTTELVYVPFGKSTSYLNPWLNLRTSLQYIGYTQANGTSTQSQNINTFMLNGWLAF